MERLVKFTMEGCGPCKTMDRFLQMLKAKPEVIDVDSEEGQILTNKLKINFVPVLAYMEGDNITKKFTGDITLSELKKFIDNEKDN